MSFSVLEKCKKARQNYIDEKKNNKKQWEVFARIVSCHFLRVWLRLFRHAREYPQLLERLGLSRFARDIFLDVACMFWHFFSGNPLGGKRKHQVTLRFTSRPTCWISDGFLSAKLFLEWSDMSDQLIISSHWPKLQVKVHHVSQPVTYSNPIHPNVSFRGLTEIHQNHPSKDWRRNTLGPSILMELVVVNMLRPSASPHLRRRWKTSRVGKTRCLKAKMQIWWMPLFMFCFVEEGWGIR